ncbi:RsbT co-antagonist protein RsbRA [Lederbergia lenta]|uniref:Positive regulator of sigma-B activity n=1 Tax=Lederbergia lenta TaxID=1467 RepID=A0A2X4VQL1_LEDLE|nr:RsbT co-antagonist protein RsbRA [Lederbergia lenta]MCM3112282.1 STAS domain-containing protein [Lederbergia lenta]MEC2326502.1 RsbT co-antagonist protein RsbRA [Lederbergia lenta]SQI53253.1 positive regulator of sigma-B activity [Lederbergia lenta]
MNKKIARYIQDHEDDLLEAWMHEMKKRESERGPNSVSNEMYYNTSKEFISIIVSNVLDSNDKYTKKMGSFAENIVRLGWPLTFITTGLQVLSTIVYERMIEEKELSAEQINEMLIGFDNWMMPISNKMIEIYSETWEKTVSLQKIALQELSAPLIPVFEKISIMPLVGTIDTERARLIMENLLTGVVKHRADVVLIDITGVPVVDTMVAHHIIQAADAVRLVGARCMLVGIRPEIAQTIVNLGINLSQVTTTSTLRKGIEKALEFTNRKIVSLEGMR